MNCRVGYCHCHLKCVLRSISRVQTENCTIDKHSSYVKLLLFSKRVLLVILSEAVEWAIAMLVAPLELYCAIVSGYCLSFKLSGKGYILLGPELPTGDSCMGTSQPLKYSIVLHHWRLFFSIRFEFQVIRKGCEGSGDDS